MALLLPCQKTVPEAQQILEGEEYDKASKSYGGMHIVALPLQKSGSMV